MIIKKLEVAGLKAFEQAEFEFQPGMNLLVGVNGVGKTTVLDALRICLTKIGPFLNDVSLNSPQGFTDNDIRIGADSMKVSCDLEHLGKSFNLLIYKQVEDYLDITTEDGEETINSPEFDEITPKIQNLFPNARQAKEQPLGLFFSTRRSVYVDRSYSIPPLLRGQSNAFAGALNHNREFNIQEISHWMKVQEALAEDLSLARKHLEVLRKAADEFLPTCKNLRLDSSGQAKLLIDKEDKTLNVQYLSDGEKSMLTLALDLARRLSQANPKLDDPLVEGKAVVLIDELDLHLHPKWQRTIVSQLTTTFPNCQFIATTHSPQVIGEVPPERILIINNSTVYSPKRSYGIDSSRILEELMDAEPRTSEVKEQLSELFELISQEKLAEARGMLKILELNIGEGDPEITRARTLIDFLTDDLL